MKQLVNLKRFQVEMTLKGYNANNDPQKPVSVRSFPKDRNWH
jgi:hypothetical protein